MLYSQWTKEDSVWVQDVLSGKREVHLNPETWKAIESGTLINTEHDQPLHKRELTPSPFRAYITKDFSEYLKPIENPENIDPFSIPPSVFIRQGLDMPLPQDKINKAAFPIPQNIKDNAVRPSGNSFDDLLKYLFIPSERAKARNRKKANAWKTY
jgi:hypothetical protein